MPPAPPGLESVPEGHVTDIAEADTGSRGAEGAGNANYAVVKKLASNYLEVNWHVATHSDVLEENKPCLPAEHLVLVTDMTSGSSPPLW